tara:strand:+ start:568 stop:846 length:279 start_codon:yes stop_codon:yes gene_type:complete
MSTFNLENATVESATNALDFFMRAPTRDERIELIGEYLSCMSIRHIRQYVDGKRTIRFYVENTINGKGCLMMESELKDPPNKALLDSILPFN